MAPLALSAVFSEMSLAGGIFEGIGNLEQAKSADALGERNAKVYEQQAQQERESQNLLAQQKQRIIKSRIGEQTANVAAGGLKMTGSSLAVMVDSLTNANLDIAIDKYNSETRARAFESEAAMSRYEGKQNAARYRTRATTSFLSAGTNFLKDRIG